MPCGNRERGVGAVVAEVDAAGHLDAGQRRALGRQVGPGRLFQRAERLGGQPGGRLGRQRRLDGGLAHRDHVGQADAVGGQRARQRVDEHAGHAEGVGHRARVLAARAAEGGQHVPGHVVAALDRDLLDRVGHVRHRDLEEPGRDLLGVAPVAGGGGDLGRQRGEPAAGLPDVERTVAADAEDAREVLRLHPPEQHVGVGHGQRAAAAVAGRAGVGAGRVRADPVPAVVEVQDRSAAGRHRVDGQHRRAHPHPGDLGLVLPLELPRVMRDVGRRAAHVEADHTVEAGRRGRPRHPDDAARRAGQDRVLPPERRPVGQPAVGLHEQQPDPGQLGRHLVDVAPQHRRQVGVDHARVAPRDQPHQRADLVRLADLREPDGGGDRRDPLLVRGVPVAVQADHGDGAVPGRVGRPQLPFDGVGVQRPDQLAVRADPLGRLDHPVVERLGEDDMPVEDARPVLVGDPQRVAEPLGDHQHGRLAVPLEERVGGDRGAEPDGGDPLGRQRLARLEAEQVPDAGHGGVPVGGADRQQLVRDQVAVRRSGHDVGERPAPVNPELPLLLGHPSSLQTARRGRGRREWRWGPRARFGNGLGGHKAISVIALGATGPLDAGRWAARPIRGRRRFEGVAVRGRRRFEGVGGARAAAVRGRRRFEDVACDLGRWQPWAGRAIRDDAGAAIQSVATRRTSSARATPSPH